VGNERTALVGGKHYLVFTATLLIFMVNHFNDVSRLVLSKNQSNETVFTPSDHS
jgi:hypothetical protein